MVVVDSSVLIDFINGVTNPETQWLDFALEHQRLGLPTLVLTELLMGLRTDREAALVHTQLREFESFDLLESDIAVDAAKHYRYLRNEGRTIRKTIDLIIATYCIRHKHSLLHRDRDFDVFEERLGLRVVHP